jgi:hypothetical protein
VTETCGKVKSTGHASAEVSKSLAFLCFTTPFAAPVSLPEASRRHENRTIANRPSTIGTLA